MFAPADFPKHVSDTLIAFAAAIALGMVLMATAIAPASPALASGSIAMGVLA
ncbi:MAG: hypothetical protein QNI87_09450 [Erythrobacter sp.]|uniref:hypothetical protein n=1 Tax=Erythrobacter sp. TaxID=1042 RepID=UPI002618A313|nr:hypothetical protein [Erythrobacter sp.]MDJ0978751.1 hypothetical protein [Erythrobacter sp.]